MPNLQPPPYHHPPAISFPHTDTSGIEQVFYVLAVVVVEREREREKERVWVWVCGCDFTFVCPSIFSKYSESVRLDRMGNFRFIKYIAISNGSSSALRNFARFCHFNALNSNPVQTSDDVQTKTDTVCSCKISV